MILLKRGLTLAEVVITLLVGVLLIWGILSFVFLSINYLRDLNAKMEEVKVSRSLTRFFENELRNLINFVPTKSNQVKIGNNLYLLPKMDKDGVIFSYIKRSTSQGVYFIFTSLIITSGTLYLREQKVLEDRISEDFYETDILQNVKIFQPIFFDHEIGEDGGAWLPDWKSNYLPRLVGIKLIFQLKNKNLIFFRTFKINHQVLN